MATDTATVSVHPLPLANFEALINSGCVPLCVQFKDLSTVAGGTITQWDWSFGKNDTTSSKEPIYCYPDTGTFSVSLTVTSNAGCRSTLIHSNMITVYPLPKANFTYSPSPVGILNPTVQFTSTGSSKYPVVYWNWNFGDGVDSTSYLTNPQHTYSDTGTYCVTLVVESRTGCTDTVTNCLVVEPDFTLYIPNAFTPNADGLNETFMPKGSYIENYDMYIFDRWEAQIFHSNEITTGWNGRVNGSGTVCQEGTYLYLINVTDSRGKTHSYTGMVNLMK
jgi:gliding motility-associated-like protein